MKGVTITSWPVSASQSVVFHPEADKPAGPPSPALWLAFQNGSLLIAKSGEGAEIPFAGDLSSLGLEPVRSQFIGTIEGHPCFSAEIPAAAPAPEGWSFAGLRSLFSVLGEAYFRIAGRASQIVDWDRDHMFCGRCGAAMERKAGERAKECPACSLVSYPRISPAAIVAVVRDRRLLLAHAMRFPKGFFSVLAGFVDAGESLEECIHREVREEAGIEIANLRYFASQPWPFPNSLMVAFTAEHADGEIAIDGKEIDEADWYPPEALPLRLPDRASVARRLIEWFLRTYGRPAGAGPAAQDRGA